MCININSEYITGMQHVTSIKFSIDTQKLCRGEVLVLVSGSSNGSNSGSSSSSSSSNNNNNNNINNSNNSNNNNNNNNTNRISQPVPARTHFLPFSPTPSHKDFGPELIRHFRAKIFSVFILTLISCMCKVFEFSHHSRGLSIFIFYISMAVRLTLFDFINFS